MNSQKYNTPLYRVELVQDGRINGTRPRADSPANIADIAREVVGRSPKEHFLLFMLSATNEVIGVNVVSVGTLTASLVHPREVFAPAIVASAAAVVVAHNHPSGDPAPSAEDKTTTKRIVQAGKILGIPVVDHVIIAGTRQFSFRGAGLL